MSESRLPDYLEHIREAATRLFVVWDTVQTALPALLKDLRSLDA
jgi:hypothetical protein